MQGEKVNEKTHLRVCQDCDLLQRVPLLKPGQRVRCVRCRSILEKKKSGSLDRSLALAFTGVVLFVLSNLFPLLSLKAQGVELDATLIATSIELYKIDRPFLGILVFFTTIVFPLLSLIGMIYVLGLVKLGQHGEHMGAIFRFLNSTEVWGMLEVFLLAIMVAGVKLGDMAEVIPGVSLYSFFALIIILTMLGTSLNPDDVWNHEREVV